MRVVQRLEIVEVEEHQRAITCAAFARGHGLTQAVIEQAPVRQFGEWIVKSQLAYFVFHQLALGDVARHHDHSLDLPVVIPNHVAH
jgi:hypothetical protein